MPKTSLLFFCFIFTVACKKDKQPRTPTQILISRPWTLQGVGFDDNRNGLIDKEENILTECQQDNTHEFRFDGTGIIRDAGLSCDSPVHNFKWKLVNNDKELDLEYYVAPIVHLSEREMILTNQYLVNFRVVYKR